MMKSLIPVLILIILFSSCKKIKSDFLWEKSYGSGEALFLKESADSGFISCGVVDDKPYFIRFDKNRNQKIVIRGENPGLFSSAWFDTSGYVAAGNSGGKMLLMRYSPGGKVLWEKSIDGGFNIDYTTLKYTGNGTLLAIGTASPDSSASGATGILFESFDTTGLIITEKKIDETSFVAANDAVIDNEGNIFIALTRKDAGSKTKASVAKFNNLFQKLWETELYNNPSFGAACLAIKLDAAGNVYVAGRTELSSADGNLDNSFLVSLSDKDRDNIRWKKYLENSNSGMSVIFDSDENLMMLNMNCFIINIINPDDGTEARGRIRMFDSCDPYSTDAFGADIGINYDKNILIAGSREGSFYLALKSSQ
jgi:hypothetical protein